MHTKALAREADMQCFHDNFLRKITDGFTTNLDSHVVILASWAVEMDNAMALLSIKQCKDVAYAQCFHDNCAAVTMSTPWKAATDANMLSA